MSLFSRHGALVTLSRSLREQDAYIGSILPYLRMGVGV